ncbi:MAG: type II secretion system protein GspN [Thermodesulfobacteriota bacterium]|nr:type II secretion system protein GspN [Thermodesulfobacteriota bacterium]
MSESGHVNMKQLQRWWSISILVGLFFVLGLWLFFPTQTVELYLEQQLSQQLSKQLQCPVTISNVDLDLPAALTIGAIETTVPPAIPIRLTNLCVTPAWLQTFTGTPTVSLNANTLGGTISVQLTSSRHIQFAAAALQLNTALPQMPALHIKTTIECCNASGFAEPINKLEQFDLHLSELQLIGMQQLGLPADQLNLGSVHLQLSQNNQRICIDQMTSTDGDIIIKGNGHISLQRNLPHSPIDLTLTISPQKSLDQSLTTLLPMFAKQQKDGSYTIHIGGTIAMPKLQH